LHHGNASSHTPICGKAINGRKAVSVLEHSTYSFTCSRVFFMFLKAEFSLKDSYFESLEDIYSNVTTTRRGLSENDFQQCFQAR